MTNTHILGMLGYSMASNWLISLLVDGYSMLDGTGMTFTIIVAGTAACRAIGAWLPVNATTNAKGE